MNKNNCQLIYRFDLNSINFFKSHKFILSLFICFIVIIADNYLLNPQIVIAQEQDSIPISLDKDVIYVNPKSGDDSQSGKKSTPFKTITQALAKAASGSKIQLAAGTYNEDTGESFPLIIERQITLQGNLNNQGHQIIIQGGGDFVSPTGAGQNVAIAALKDAGKIAGITITNDHSRGHGLWIESASPEIVSNTFTRNGNTGVSINGKSSPLIEDNYFYNNSGNGLLVYGTSQAKVIKNTFEQTGFGISLIQNAIATLTSNYFDGNRIGIILEGNSQAILRDNEVINSSESGLTAIANSRVNLGTSEEPGNNVFRSNKKLDLQNATNHEIVAVGTEVHSDIAGNINFNAGNFALASNTINDSRPLLAPLNLPKQDNSNNDALDRASSVPTSGLPSPPPVLEPKSSSKELVFTPSSNTISEALAPEPVPFLPQINTSALSTNSSQVSSLSDVLGSSSNISVKYKVLVEAIDQYAAEEVKELYPEAFATIYQGKSVLQIGAFNNWNKAKEAKRSLEDLGLNAHILE